MTVSSEPKDPRESLSALAQAVRDLSSAASPLEVVEALRRSTRQLCGARGVTVVAREGDLCHYLADDSENALWPDRRFPMEKCISGWAMLEGRAAVISDIYQDNRIPHEAYRATFVRSLVMTPIGEGRAFAALGAYWDHLREPSALEVDLLSALTACAASALEKLWLELRSTSSKVAARADAGGKASAAASTEPLIAALNEAAPSDRRLIHRLEQVLQRRWQDPLQVEDVASACGVSVRAVFLAFRRTHGATPMQYLRNLRLDHAQSALLASEGQASVLEVARKCGFASFGHFAQRYSERFGENPSDTVRRSRASSRQAAE